MPYSIGSFSAENKCDLFSAPEQPQSKVDLSSIRIMMNVYIACQYNVRNNAKTDGDVTGVAKKPCAIGTFF